jgi:hypothetical protein
METEGVQEALERIHQHEDAEGDGPEDWPRNNTEDNGSSDVLLSEDSAVLLHEQVHEHLSQLTMGKGQSPESQVGSSVRNCSEHELNGLNHLMDEHLSERVSLILDTHSLELVLERLHLSVSLHHHVIGELPAVVLSSHGPGVSLDAGLQWLGHVIASIDVRELNLVSVLVAFRVETSVHDWLGAKHHWDQDDYNEEKGKTDGVLLVVSVADQGLDMGVRLSLVPLTESENLSNHDVDDRWRVLIHGVTSEFQDVVLATVLKSLVISIIIESIL